MKKKPTFEELVEKVGPLLSTGLASAEEPPPLKKVYEAPKITPIGHLSDILNRVERGTFVPPECRRRFPPPWCPPRR